MNTWRKVTSVFAALIVSLSAVMAVEAGTDDFEDIGLDGSAVTTRVIDGVTVTITTGDGTPFLARTYNVGIAAFRGAGDSSNAPLNPGNLSGTRFISTSYYPEGSVYAVKRLDSVMELVFEFDRPVAAFGFTTIDLAEGPVIGSDPAGELTLVALDSANQPLDFQQEYRRHVLSGGDIDWMVSSANGISKVILAESYDGFSWELDYGIDDLVIALLPTPVRSATWGAIKALYN
jgi:hypothetical protein